MKTKITTLAAAFVAVSLGVAFTSADPQAEATPQAPEVAIDFSTYSTAPELSKASRSDSCTVVNPGTPQCYMMCTNAPYLRTCEEG